MRWLDGLVEWWSVCAVGSVSVETGSFKLDRHHPCERLGLFHAGGAMQQLRRDFLRAYIV